MKRTSLLFIFLAGNCLYLSAQENTNLNKFRQLKQEFATPNVYRTASGAPGHEYWQQKADYKIDIKLDDENQRIYGYETITYSILSELYRAVLELRLERIQFTSKVIPAEKIQK